MDEPRSASTGWTAPAVWTHAATRLLPAAAVGAALCAALLYWAWQSGGQDEFLFGGRPIPPVDLAKMETVWARQGLTGHARQGDRVRVPRGQEARFLAALADSGTLPKDLHAEMLKLSTDINPFLSSAARSESMRLAKQNMLAKIIQEMEGIESAWVLLDSKRGAGLSSQETTTASVSVQGRDRAPLEGSRLQQIRRLVASAVAGLDPRQVTVTDLGAGGESVAENTPEEWDDPWLRKLASYRRWYRSLVKEALSSVPGAQATVYVDLDRGETNRGYLNAPTSEDALARPGNVHLAAGGRLLSQRVDPFQASLAGGGHAPFEPSAAGSDWLPHRVTAMVRIPDRSILQAWRDRLPPDERQRRPGPDAAEWERLVQTECDRVRATVAAVLPPTSAGAPSEVVVQTFASDGAPPTSAGSIPSTAAQANGLAGKSPTEPAATAEPVGSGAAKALDSAAAWWKWWEEHGQDGAMGGGALAGLMMFLRMLFGRGSREPVPAAPCAAEEPWSGDAASPAHDGEWTEDAVRQRVRSTIESDPRAAAELVRSWLAAPERGAAV